MSLWTKRVLLFCWLFGAEFLEIWWILPLVYSHFWITLQLWSLIRVKCKKSLQIEISVCDAKFSQREYFLRSRWVLGDNSCTGTQRSLLSQSGFSLWVRWDLFINTKVLLFQSRSLSGDFFVCVFILFDLQMTFMLVSFLWALGIFCLDVRNIWCCITVY